jgi:hypothetical protein
MAGKPAFDKSTAGKFWFGRSAFGGVGKEKKLRGSLEKRAVPIITQIKTRRVNRRAKHYYF